MTGPPPASAARPLAVLLDAVSGERMAVTVATLAGEPFSGRRAGSAGGAAARSWLARHLADLGATVSTTGFTVRFVPEVYAPPSVQWYDGGRVHRLTAGRDVAVHLASADEALVRRGELAVAVAGDPTGRWLVVPAGLPLVAGPVASANRRYAAVGLAAVGIGVGPAGDHGPAGGTEPALGAVARLVVATCWLATADPATLQSAPGEAGAP
ncbi:hypothetical protein OHA72_34190 [Dactylosporangium sp. NBC_01737]|uniref:hypothetical protein n=1 Tax=Dactylosporangium sp. NBC_01737 TaxID=2975959 RepID=UPI002E0F415F|nr:hypothetical protein OHA72_34190 [Dactylosporangium sp. NBC_01737]